MSRAEEIKQVDADPNAFNEPLDKSPDDEHGASSLQMSTKKSALIEPEPQVEKLVLNEQEAAKKQSSLDE